MAKGEAWVSDELLEILSQLSAQQAAGVLRIVQAELEGHSLSSLLDCPGQICTSTTFYGSGKRGGWRHKPEFNQALELARRDYRRWMLDHGVGDALALLSQAAPEAARALRQEITGDASAIGSLKEFLSSDDPEVRKAAAIHLGDTGQPEIVPALRSALQQEENPEVRMALIAALGKVAAWRDDERREAARSILDRADVKTAAKRALGLEGEVSVAVEFDEVTDEEHDAIEAALRAETEGGGQTQ
jgi:hypothetical protein